jgi:hypothetical protein
VELDIEEKRAMRIFIITAILVLWGFFVFICWALVAGASKYDHEYDYHVDDNQKGENKWE